MTLGQPFLLRVIEFRYGAVVLALVSKNELHTQKHILYVTRGRERNGYQ